MLQLRPRSALRAQLLPRMAQFQLQNVSRWHFASASLCECSITRKNLGNNGAIVYWGYIGIMEKKMETTIDNGKENGNYYSILGLYR